MLRTKSRRKSGALPKLPTPLSQLCQSMSLLPIEIKGIVIDKILSQIRIKPKHLQFFLDYFKYVPNLEVQVSVNDLSQLTINTKYTRPFKVDQALITSASVLLASARVKEVVFMSGSYLSTYKRENNCKRENTYSNTYNYSAVDFLFNSTDNLVFDYKQYDGEYLNKLPFNKIKTILSSNCIPPLDLISLFKNLKLAKVTITDSFYDYEELEALSDMVPLLDVTVSHIVSPTYFDNVNFQRMLNFRNTTVHLNITIMPDNDEDMDLIKELDINVLAINERFETLQYFDHVKRVSLETLPPSRYKIPGNNSVREITATVTYANMEIDVSFQNLKKLKTVSLSGNVTNYCFHSIPKTTRMLRMSCAAIAPNFMTMYHPPIMLRYFKATSFRIDMLPFFNKCPNLEVLQLLNCTSPEEPELMDDGPELAYQNSILFWESLPESLEEIRIQYSNLQNDFFGTPGALLLRILVNSKIKRVEISLEYTNPKLIALATTNPTKPVVNPYSAIGPYIQINNVSRDKVLFNVNDLSSGVFFKKQHVKEIKVETMNGDVPNFYHGLPKGLNAYSVIDPPGSIDDSKIVFNSNESCNTVGSFHKFKSKWSGVFKRE